MHARLSMIERGSTGMLSPCKNCKPTCRSCRSEVNWPKRIEARLTMIKQSCCTNRYVEVGKNGIQASDQTFQPFCHNCRVCLWWCVLPHLPSQLKVAISYDNFCKMCQPCQFAPSTHTLMMSSLRSASPQTSSSDNTERAACRAPCRAEFPLMECCTHMSMGRARQLSLSSSSLRRRRICARTSQVCSVKAAKPVWQ